MNIQMFQTLGDDQSSLILEGVILCLQIGRSLKDLDVQHSYKLAKYLILYSTI